MSVLNSGTGAGLLEFLDWLFNKGEINPSTARALRAAASKVLELEDDPEAVKIADVDVDQLLVRFEHKTRSAYTSGSMSTYKSRFRQAVQMYLAYLEGDANWRQVVKSRTSAQGRKSRRAPASNSNETGTQETLEDTASASSPAFAGDVGRLVSYDLPLRRDLIVRMNLPVDLTPSDAARISAFVRSLAFEVPAATDGGGGP